MLLTIRFPFSLMWAPATERRNRTGRMIATPHQAKDRSRAFLRRQEVSRKSLSEQARFRQPPADAEPRRPLGGQGRTPPFQTAPNESRADAMPRKARAHF